MHLNPQTEAQTWAGDLNSPPPPELELETSETGSNWRPEPQTGAGDLNPPMRDWGLNHQKRELGLKPYRQELGTETLQNWDQNTELGT